MSHTAVMRMSGTLTRACTRWRQRPPTPMRPIWSFWLAPRTFMTGTPKAARPAAAVPVVPRKERLETFCCGAMEGYLESSGCRPGVYCNRGGWREFIFFAVQSGNPDGLWTTCRPETNTGGEHAIIIGE